MKKAKRINLKNNDQTPLAFLAFMAFAHVIILAIFIFYEVFHLLKIEKVSANNVSLTEIVFIVTYVIIVSIMWYLTDKYIIASENWKKNSKNHRVQIALKVLAGILLLLVFLTAD